MKSTGSGRKKEANVNVADNARIKDIEVKIRDLEVKMGIVYEWFKDSKRLLWTILAGVLLALILNIATLTKKNIELIEVVNKLEKIENGK